MTQATTGSSPGTTGVHQARWEENLTALVLFRADKGRLPKQGTGAPEQKLASWLNTQRASAQPDRVEVLDRGIPGWRKTSHDTSWDEQLAAVASFVDSHGHHPRSSSTDRDEKLLGHWLVQQRRSTTPERSARLDGRIPEWRESNRRDWTDSNARFAEFVDQNGHMPRQNAPTVAEKSLASWLKYQRQFASHERCAVLDDTVPGWRGNHPGHRSWEESFAAVRTFVGVNGHLPGQTRRDDNERRMAVWLGDQTRRATDEQRTALDAALPGWSAGAPSWEERHAAVLAFQTTNRRLPERSGTGDESGLGVWLNGQRTTATPDAREILNATLPGWHISLNDRWNARLQELCGYVATNGRIPRKRNSASGERILAGWVEKQRQHASQDRMAILDAKVPGWRGRTRAA